MTRIHELGKLGQSIWYDNIRRALLDSGELQALIDDGVTVEPSALTVTGDALGYLVSGEASLCIEATANANVMLDITELSVTFAASSP